MTDFLRANPFVSKEEYLWKWTVPQVKLSSYDFSHEVYIPKRKKKVESIDSAEDLVNSCGIPLNALKNKI